MTSPLRSGFLSISFSFFLLCLLPQVASAQQVKSAIGARLGYPLTASYKHFLSDEGALEATLGFRPFRSDRYTTAGLAYLHHIPLELEDDLAPLHAYFGGGGHVLLWTYDDLGSRNLYASTTLGISAYAGLQYAFEAAPIELTADIMPTLYLGSVRINRIGFNNWTLGVRYILSRQ